ncbi:hypothetical protein G6F46_012170 [Rhizopus delemar]|uniref:Reverse transcriptase domain-containing protein n=1 Tax=Rhizopus delemar TaxID=936053 RepID=A0A9P7CIF5_9FUNG|nr:hypothetical protein G6F55_011906 [Rhizopus delemar]KAG1617582.1 hypothetical protein G6F45_012090 [Rhizopus arrhizus]KAG1488537.1 hypothetical protein G6F54_012025 [Rhizopus delemar]KAG1510644.1 hypothetical protein G6F52_010848 [Rhizopus delemar]KAG1562269.1 hypothetical protein G6F50_012116 [Rhizopus delemar]
MHGLKNSDNNVTDVSQLNIEANESEMAVCYTTSTTNDEETAEGNIDETEENDNTEQDEQRVDIVECKKWLREAYETILMYKFPLDDLDLVFTLAKACLRRMILQRRKETWRQFCDQMEQGEYTKAIAKFCKIRKNRTLKPSFSTIEGPQHAANVMASHLRSIYSGHLLQEADRTFPSLGNPTTPFEIETCPITLEDIHTSLKRLPPKKAPGIDHSSLDLAQGGFWEVRGSLDQDLCLAEICTILRCHHSITPVLDFLDMKSAYDAVDRHYIWKNLENNSPEPLICLLRNLFDEVQIEVLLNNATSSRFSPVTGVLQGSILSPFLYSIYINDLPKPLRPQPIEEDLFPIQLAPFMTCLLYADDVVLIADQHQMVSLLKRCEDHSQSLGYRWNPSKCVVLDPTDQSLTCTLYGDAVPTQPFFSYLGIPFRPGGYLDTFQLLNVNTNKALATMNQLSAIGLHPKGFSPLLAVRFYMQIVRAQLEYGLAITKITSFLTNKFEDAQNTCIRRIFGGSSRSSTKVMLHLTKLPSMQERAYILQSQFLLRSFTLPEDTLLSHLFHLYGKNAYLTLNP